MKTVVLALAVLGVIHTSSGYGHDYEHDHGHVHSSSFEIDHSEPERRTFDYFKDYFSPAPHATKYFSNFFDDGAVVPQHFQTAPDPALTCGSAPSTCEDTRYRTLDGSCNNLHRTDWGTAQSRYGRLIPAKYGDSVSSPTLAQSNQPLPNARVTSLVLFPDGDVDDPLWTLANMQWGQIITHDMSMLAGSTQSKRHSTRCCTDDGQLVEKSRAHVTCYPIIVPKEDPVHSLTNTQCINFVRTLTDRDRRCSGSRGNAAEQLTVVTAYMDMSLVYGNSEAQNNPLRAGRGGRLLVEVRRGRQWPPSAPNNTAACDVQSSDEVCYLAGDTRVNQNPQLTVLQIILMREHNRIADTLFELNPHWDDETCFQESRRINIAQYQHINYYEWLPIYLGKENMLKNRLIFQTKSHVNDYDPNIDPSVLNGHATAAFRYFHSLIAGHLDLVTEPRNSFESLTLSDWFNRPAVIEQNDNMDDLTRGLCTQPQKASDPLFDPEIKHRLFRRNMPFGADLRAIDIQRNRDHGLASYNDYREFCGLPRAHSFQDFNDFISSEDVEKLQSLYEDPEDVDLTVGGSLEAHVTGSLSGPTFLCILTEQFFRTRVGDRYFYERGDKPVAFTKAQLNQIRQASISRLLCDNGDSIRSMQPSGFERVSDSNAVTDCENLPYVDLSHWQEIRQSH